MEKLVGVKYQWSGKVLGKVTILTEPRVGFMFNKYGEVNDTKTCLVRCKCGSKHEVRFKYISQGYSGKCPVCGQSNMRKVPVGRTKSLFGYWMSQWNPTTHKPCTYKLPFFKGIIGEEYIAGFCYVSKGVYNHCKKVMCVKPKNYAIYNYSKENCERLGLEYLGCKTRKSQFIHRLMLKEDVGAADHVNNRYLDNRETNIRKASISDNNYNKRRLDSNTTGYTGVVHNTREKKSWRAQIGVNRHTTSKLFYTKEEAVEYRDCLALYYFGEFAKLNIPDKLGYYKENLYNILDDRHLKWDPFRGCNDIPYR